MICYSVHPVGDVRVADEQMNVAVLAPAGTIRALGFGLGPVVALDLGHFIPLIEDDLGAAKRGLELRLLVDAEDPLEAARSLGVRTRAGTAPWSPRAQVTATRAVSVDGVAAAARAVRADLITVVRPEGQRR